jgi:hypothetical protein
MDLNPAAAIHRMLDGEKLPAQIFSVVDSTGSLTTSPEELEEVMTSHFESVFDLPHPEPEPPHPPAMLHQKPDIESHWYHDLMNPISPDDLLHYVADSALVSAAGEDGVSTGVWKIAIQESELAREQVSELFSACLATSTFPSAWKTSVIVPLIKDSNKERTMNNIRPISLQNCLGKLFNKILARRLGSILQRYPILNPSQRGFVLGGTTMKCIDELLDAWDWSRNGFKELHTIFYDIKQAYDCVQVEVLVRAMHRLSMPASFIDLIANSLTGLSSCIRTMYGLSRSFPVRRSLRQGDPLAPLLFVILMDALHDGLETNPFDGQKYGCTLTFLDGEVVYLPSLGYADDTTVLANSLSNLRKQNEWVQYFMRFNRMKLNPTKCELIGRQVDGSGAAQHLTLAAVTAAGITIDGHPPMPIHHHQPIRYLGAHMCFNGDWKPQRDKATAAVSMFTRLVSKFDLSIGHAVYMFNVFLLTRLELALHYVHGLGTSQWINNLDRLIIGSIKHSCGSLLRLSHSALTSSLSLLMPSWLEKAVKVSELFIRMNSSDKRWGRLGRISMRKQCPGHLCIDEHSALQGPSAGSQSTRAVYLAVKKLQWSIHLSRPSKSSRHRHLFELEPVTDVPTLDCCSSSHVVELKSGLIHVAHDCWSGWHGPIPDAQRDEAVDVYTDGSHDEASSSSAWSATVADRWLIDNFGTVPSDERILAGQAAAYLGGSSLFGSAIRCSVGIYPAELQAIARVLAMFPLALDLCVHSDSQSSIRSIHAFLEEPNERKRLRSAARTILRLIAHLFRRRLENGGGETKFVHIRAHTDGMDLHSVGNRMADFQANLARCRPDRSYPLNLRDLPLEKLEPHLHIKDKHGRVIIDDIRRTARNQIRSQAFSKWQAKLEKDDLVGQFAHAGIVDMGRVVLKHGSFEEQQTFVHVATNSIHYYCPPIGAAGRRSPVQQHHCVPCDHRMTVYHLMICPQPPAVALRRSLQHDILTGFDGLDECYDWLQAMSRVELSQLVSALFPLPDAVTDDVRLDHDVRCMIGAFTRSECLRAIKLLGIEDPKQGTRAFQNFRCVCLEHIAKFYASL